MGSLIASNALEVVVDLGVKTGVLEVLLVVLGKTIAVEGVLEVLQSQSILKNVGYFC